MDKMFHKLKYNIYRFIGRLLIKFLRYGLEYRPDIKKMSKLAKVAMDPLHMVEKVEKYKDGYIKVYKQEPKHNYKEVEKARIDLVKEYLGPNL